MTIEQLVNAGHLPRWQRTELVLSPLRREVRPARSFRFELFAVTAAVWALGCWAVTMW